MRMEQNYRAWPATSSLLAGPRWPAEDAWLNRGIEGVRMSDPALLSASELSREYKRKTLSPVEATRAVLDRIARLNKKVNALNLVDPEAALAAAKAAERRWAKRKPLSPIDGVPTSIKDLILTKGWPTLRGSRTVDADQPWLEDAPSVARLREAGAVLIGKSTTPEYGWKGVTDSTLTGVTRNPWNRKLTPGGSSGGASAALAAGMGALAVGTDGGGSIRIPASFAGVFGLKPSFGRVPAYPLSVFGTVAHVGPMARTVTDAAMMLNVIAKPDPRDWTALPPEPRDWTRGLEGGVKGLRVAWSPTLGYARLRDDVRAVVEVAVRRLARLGAKLRQVDPPIADPRDCFRTLWWAGAGQAFRTLGPDKLKLLDPALRKVVKEGQRISLERYLAATQERSQIATVLRRFVGEEFDLLVTPTVAVTAFPVRKLFPDGEGPDAEPWIDWTPFTFPFNLSQQPACSVSCGFTAEGLPVGLQIVGPMFREDLVLRAARAYERAYPERTLAPL
jgi:aspartyl-tRNA(Asn)/glutamyl-tRNA(Gln) amidotransferase subunit A